jgi:anti-sigma regulatory factor (Ser/Thr protein kinase)
VKQSDVWLKFLVPSDPRFLALIRGAVEALGSAYGLAGPECRQVTLAIDEAMTNIIRHAYGNAPDRPIELRCQGRADLLEFTLLDHGEPPDRERLSAQLPDDLALGGRGTHIIRAVMDEVAYESVARGNRLRLRKLLPARPFVAAERHRNKHEHRDAQQ